ncbi:MAG: TonB C-terminal domain-containing protein [Nitrospira sp.]|nr:TonB C-terminal domain-containing protein [Nitrospira sp.]
MNQLMAGVQSPSTINEQSQKEELRYLSFMEKTIDRHWTAYSSIRSTTQAVVSFKVEKSGQTFDVKIEESSGPPAN